MRQEVANTILHSAAIIGMPVPVRMSMECGQLLSISFPETQRTAQQKLGSAPNSSKCSTMSLGFHVLMRCLPNQLPVLMRQEEEDNHAPVKPSEVGPCVSAVHLISLQSFGDMRGQLHTCGRDDCMCCAGAYTVYYDIRGPPWYLMILPEDTCAGKLCKSLDMKIYKEVHEY